MLGSCCARERRMRFAEAQSTKRLANSLSHDALILRGSADALGALQREALTGQAEDAALVAVTGLPLREQSDENGPLVVLVEEVPGRCVAGGAVHPVEQSLHGCLVVGDLAA